MKTIISTLVVLTSLSTMAASRDHNFKCVGQDRYGKNVEVVFFEYANERQSAEANVQVKVGEKTKSYNGLEVYADSEGGFDYGVTGNDFMFHLVLPPNWVGNDQVGGQLYFGKSYKSPKAYLQCKAIGSGR